VDETVLVGSGVLRLVGLDDGPNHRHEFEFLHPRRPSVETRLVADIGLHLCSDRVRPYFPSLPHLVRIGNPDDHVHGMVHDDHGSIDWTCA